MSSATVLRLLASAFGLMMVSATAIATQGAVLAGAAAAAVLVLVGNVFRPAATLAVMVAAATLAFGDPPVLMAALGGLSATVYLALRHTGASAALTLTPATVAAALGFTAAGLLATALPVRAPWVPLLAPVAAVVVYLLALLPVRAHPSSAATTEVTRWMANSRTRPDAGS